MELSNFKTALSPLVRKETAELVLSPSFTIHVIGLSAGNQTYRKSQTDFIKKNPKHQLITDQDAFNRDLLNHVMTADTINFVANVLVADWDLRNDDGKSQRFSPKAVKEAFQLPHGIGGHIFSEIIETSMNKSQYEVDWEKTITKNS